VDRYTSPPYAPTIPVAVVFGSSMTAFRDRVIEVIAEDGEHPVEREALP